MDSIDQFAALEKVWHRLPARTRGGILVIAGVFQTPKDGRTIQRTKSGEAPHWLPTALNILKDAKADISDRAMARRLGVAQSTLARNILYQHARKTFMIEVGKPVLRYGRSGKSKPPKT